MLRLINLFMLFLMPLACMPQACAQDISTVAEKVRGAVEEELPCWKLFREQQRKAGENTVLEQDWLHGEESVEASLYQTPSVEAAHDLFQRMRNAPVESPGRAIDSHKFGEESWVTSYSPYSRSSYVFFRRGDVVVRIDAGTTGEATSARTLQNAVGFARLFIAQMRPPPKGACATGASAFLNESMLSAELNSRRVVPVLGFRNEAVMSSVGWPN